MKKTVLSFLFPSLFALSGWAQDAGPKSGWPLTVTLFSESVSLPNFRSIFKNGNLGIRIGTEFYYRQSNNRQLLQTVQVGYYKHPNLQTGLYLSSEFGYRKFFGNAFADATIGAGYLLLNSALPRYEQVGTSFVKASSLHHKIMPTLGLGGGYRFKEVSVFSRYELFGEMPFGLGGIPVLPHKAIHLGTRIHFK